VRSLRGGDGQPFQVNAASVYVQNATRGLGVYEISGLAHVAYFNNPAVWETIVCGADYGKRLC
jgi:hypothetical protein